MEFSPNRKFLPSLTNSAVLPPYRSTDTRPGEVAEWSNAPDSKSGVPFGYRGFESLPLRQLLVLNQRVNFPNNRFAS